MNISSATVLRTLYNHCLENNFQHPHMEVAEDLLKRLITIRDIKMFVYDCLGLSEEEGDKKSNKQRCVTARFIAMSFAKKYGKWTLTDIGNEIGGKDHAVVYHAIKTINNHYEFEKEFKKLYDMIEKSLKQNFNL
jgi:chromosomal replication initiator protein